MACGGAVLDFDFHPDEEGVRVFTCPARGVLRLTDDVYVSAGRYGDVVLWHYAFARHWFKVNLTTDLDGRITEAGDDFAFNCDVATPMRRQGGEVFAVDLFADVLVRAEPGLAGRAGPWPRVRALAAGEPGALAVGEHAI